MKMKVKTIKIEITDKYVPDKDGNYTKIYSDMDEILNHKLAMIENNGNKIINIQCTRKGRLFEEYLVLYKEKENVN